MQNVKGFTFRGPLGVHLRFEMFLRIEGKLSKLQLYKTLIYNVCNGVFELFNLYQVYNVN